MTLLDNRFIREKQLIFQRGVQSPEPLSITVYEYLGPHARLRWHLHHNIAKNFCLTG
jgi:hypothetical protein